MRSIVPPDASDNERPTAYADRIGRWYAARVSQEHKKRFGQYLTPVQVADFMVGLCEIQGDMISILDPGAGAGVLACAAAERLALCRPKPSQLRIEAYETDAELAVLLEKSLWFLRGRLRSEGVSVTFRVRNEDFIIRHAEALDDFPNLFRAQTNERGFDIVISNPPYFKLSKSDPRAQAAAAVVNGQPNIYALFMAISARMLSAGGQFVFITPRSFASGPYFRLFRERFFERIQPEHIHIFESRRDAFKRDEVLQENVILKARRRDAWYGKANGALAAISSSAGAQGLSSVTCRTVPLRSILDMGTADKVLRIPASEKGDRIIRMVHSWPGTLKAYGLEISTGPVVPFRAVRLLSKTGSVPKTHAPLLWMQNVHAMDVEWPTAVRKKAQYIAVTDDAMPLLLENKTYVLLRRFSAKEDRRRLTAAPLVAGRLQSPLIGLENHLNYVYRSGGILADDEAWGLAVLYNSSFLDTYFRTVNGNTQVSATELRAMPLPPLDVVADMGRRARGLPEPLGAIESLVRPALEDTPDTIEKAALRG